MAAIDTRCRSLSHVLYRPDLGSDRTLPPISNRVLPQSSFSTYQTVERHQPLVVIACNQKQKHQKAALTLYGDLVVAYISPLPDALPRISKY